MRRHPDIELLESQTIHAGRIFEVVRESLRLPSGMRQELDVVDHGGAVAIAAEFRSGELLLVRQYRHAAGDWLVEVPAGRVELGEERLAAARRALEEETGHRAGRWEELATFLPAPGFCSEEITLFHAQDLEPVPGGGLAADEDEEIELVRLEPRDLLNATRDGKTLLAAALLSSRAR